MKILLISDTYHPYRCGITYALDLMKRQLTDLGHEVYIATLKFKDFDYTPYQDHLILLDAKLAPFPRAKKDYLYRLVHFKKNYELLKSYHFDFIHLNCDFTSSNLARKIQKDLNIPMVYTWHTMWYIYFSKLYCGFPAIVGWFIEHIWMRKNLNAALITIAPTHKVVDWCNDKLHLHPYMKVLPTGINLFKFENYDPEEIKKIKKEFDLENKDVVVYVGRVSPEKNIHKILTYLRKPLLANPDLVLFIVGDGSQLESLKLYVKQNKLENSVKFAGPVSSNVIQNYYRCGKVFVTGSKMETQGFTYMEAMASQVPILCQKDHAVDGLINDGINGFTFDSKYEFLSKLRHILVEDMSHIIKRAYERVQTYDEKIYGKKLEAVYYDAIRIHQKRQEYK